MNQLNSIILEGNLSQDPVMSEIAEGKSSRETEFQIAVKRYYKGQSDARVEEVSFFDVFTYGVLAESIVTKFNLKKDDGVRIVGRLKQVRYKDAHGMDCSKIIVIAEHVEVMRKKPKEIGGN